MQTWIETYRKEAAEKFRSLRASPKNRQLIPSSFLSKGDFAALETTGGNVASLPTVPQGVYLASWEMASKEKLDWMRIALEGSSAYSLDPYFHLSTVYGKSGFFLNVEKGHNVSGVIVLPLKSEGAFGARRNLIRLEEGSTATLVLQVDASAIEAFRCEATTFVLEAGAHLKVTYVGQAHPGETFFQEEYLVGEGALLESNSLLLAGNSFHFSQKTKLQGKKSKAVFRMGEIGVEAQSSHVSSEIFHEGEDSQSDFRTWYVNTGRSKATFDSCVKVEKGVKNAQSNQKLYGLIPSGTPTVTAIPRLLISHDAVKCAHGAFVTGVSEEQLHYFRCRGIGQAEAKEMIVAGFLAPALAEISDESVRESCLVAATGRLGIQRRGNEEF